MGLKSRTKGKSGEREVAALIAELTGWDVRRRVRQHEGDSDLEGVPGWSIEVKRHATATRSEIAGWYAQAARQAAPVNKLPVLFYRRDRDEWRAVWPLSANIVAPPCGMREDRNSYKWTCEGTVEAWAMVVMDRQEYDDLKDALGLMKTKPLVVDGKGRVLE